MKKTIAFFFFFLVVIKINAQRDSELDIQYLKINDTAISNSLERFIDYKSAIDSIFKNGVGYIRVRGKKYIQKIPYTGLKDTLYEFDVYDTDNPIYKKTADMAYPGYYTQIKSRIVTFYFDDGPSKLTHIFYTEISKSLFRKKLTPFLNPLDQKNIEEDSGEEVFRYKGYNKFMKIYTLRDNSKISVWEVTGGGF
jgi:hypothetical protein